VATDIQEVGGIDRLIHEPARLMVIALLASVEEADFKYLQQATGLTKGNLSIHLSKLEEAGYIRISKGFRGKFPLTLCSITDEGRRGFESYRKTMLRFYATASKGSAKRGTELLDKLDRRPRG
jgi:DNA-binding MarR family transcriptional regulator